MKKTRRNRKQKTRRRRCVRGGRDIKRRSTRAKTRAVRNYRSEPTEYELLNRLQIPSSLFSSIHSERGLSKRDINENYSELMIYYAKKINKMGQDNQINLKNGWGDCLEGCFDLCSEAVSEELDHVQYYINVIRNGFGKYGKRVQFSSVTDSSWSKEKGKFMITGLRGSRGDRYRGGGWSGGRDMDIVLLSGPSASGKSFWVKEELLGSLFSELYPKDTFFTIDGGSYREMCVMYQIINLLATSPYNSEITMDMLHDTGIPDKSLLYKLSKLDLRGWGGQGILNLNPTRKRDYAARKVKQIKSKAIFDSETVKDTIKDILQKSSSRAKFSLVVPDTLTTSIKDTFFDDWWELSNSQSKLTKAVVHIYQHYSQSASENRARPHTIQTKRGPIRCCKTTLQSGIERETREGKKYTSSSKVWMKSQKRGLQQCLDALKESGYCMIIHNNNNNNPGDRDEIVDYSVISLWYNKHTRDDVYQKVKRWVTKIRINVKFKGFGLTRDEIESMNNPRELIDTMEKQLLDDGEDVEDH